MSRRVLIVLLALALMLTGGAATVLAQGPSGTFVSGVSCVNLSGSAASIVVEAFRNADNGGASLGSFSDSISAGGNKQYFTGGSDSLASLMPDGTLGSVVVSSNQQIACSINTQTNGGTFRAATSNGISSDDAASTVFAPQVVKISGVFNSYVAVQNAGGPDTTVTAKFYDSSGTEITAAQQTASVPANSTHVFYQDTNANLPNGFNGSATFASNNAAKLAGTVVLYDDSSTLLAYDAFSGGASTVVGPRFVKNVGGGLFSGLACQNLSSSPTTITATFNFPGGVTGTESKSNVGQNQSFLLSAANFTNAALAAMSSGTGSVSVDGGGANIACTFNENATVGSFAGNGSTYNGVASTAATNTASFPQVVDLGSSSFQGGFQYANTTATAATCSHTYATSAGTLGTITGVSLAGNGSNPIFAPTEMANSSISAIANAAGSFNGSVTVTCDQPIVGIYNLAGLPFGGDSFTTNSAVNQ